MDVSVAFTEIEHSIPLANCSPPFRTSLPSGCPAASRAHGGMPLLLTFFLGDEVDPFSDSAAHLVVGHHPQLVGGVGLETLEAGSLPWPPVLGLGLAGGTGGG